MNDNAVLRDSMRRLLESSGYRTRCYASADDALALLEEPADVALLDKTNGAIGGLGLFRRLRESTDMPVIFVSAWAEELEEADIGAEGYVGLPLSRNTLLRTVEQALKRR